MKNADAIHTITREHRGHTITVNWFADVDHGTPWENEDGHGPVTKWERRDKRPGERVLCSDRNAKRFYDYAEAIKIARRDGWDAEPYGTGTVGERAARAVEADFARLKAWCEDRWHYVGFKCEIEGFDAYHDSCWGFESDFMDGPTAEAISAAVAFLDLEIAESQDAACRDLITA
jgi:hypothetical protein